MLLACHFRPGNIIFCNDYLEMPPVKVFAIVNNKTDLSDENKKSIGAFWGFVFKYVFGYKNQRSISVRGKSGNIKTATYFYDISSPVEVVEE